MSDIQLVLKSPEVLMLRSMWAGKQFMKLAESYELSSLNEKELTWEEMIFLKFIKKPLKEGFDKSKSNGYRLGFVHGVTRTLFTFLESGDFSEFLLSLAQGNTDEVKEVQGMIREQRIDFEDFLTLLISNTDNEELVDEYQAGYSRGQGAIINYKGLFKRSESTTIPYALMLLLRKEINRAPSVEYVHMQLKQYYPDVFNYNLESFKVFCSRIHYTGRNYRIEEAG